MPAFDTVAVRFALWALAKLCESIVCGANRALRDIAGWNTARVVISVENLPFSTLDTNGVLLVIVGIDRASYADTILFKRCIDRAALAFLSGLVVDETVSTLGADFLGHIPEVRALAVDAVSSGIMWSIKWAFAAHGLVVEVAVGRTLGLFGDRLRGASGSGFIEGSVDWAHHTNFAFLDIVRVLGAGEAFVAIQYGEIVRTFFACASSGIVPCILWAGLADLRSLIPVFRGSTRDAPGPGKIRST